MPFPHLFSPLTIGSMTLPNRIVMAPHGVVFAGGYGSAIERVIDYHIERAKGGAGLIVMSNFLVPPSWRALASWGGTLSTTPLGNLDIANDDALIPAYRKLIAGVHAHGSKFISQLNASGRQLYSPGTINFTIPLMAPSPLPCPKINEIPKEMTREDIAEYVATFADAAANMLAAGADGVEVFAAQGYLLSEFLSPNANHRIDDYGGSLENRMRFMLEVIVAIRSRTGPGFVVGVRLNTDDYEINGADVEMAQSIAVRLQMTGMVDYLNLSGMTASLYPAWIGDISAPEAQFASRAAAVRAAVPGMPTCVVSRIASAEQAEAILLSGQADMVGMARALISDPELPNKARTGRSADVRRCTYSNQSCLMGLDRGRGVGCVHNVAVGREAQLGIGTMRPAAKASKVAVVGGGPAGMAAARIAVERGHTVTLFEKTDRLGGQNLMTAAVESRRGFHEVTRWQEHMLRKSGAQLLLETSVDAPMLLAMDFDVIVVATGSIPDRHAHSSFRAPGESLDGVDAEHVATVWDIFSQLDRIGSNVIVLEEDPHFAGIAAAEHLAANGRTVHLVSPHLHAGSQLPLHHLPDLYRRLAKRHINVSPHTVAMQIEPGRVLCRDRFSGKQWHIDGIDSVVLALANRADNALYRALVEAQTARGRGAPGALQSGRDFSVYAIGDCVAPRQIDHAITDGERVGWML
jgi:2,4-dienoyl-CoA reductase-like NADH-dependent reductase (Old Yellow Enzyme family)